MITSILPAFMGKKRYEQNENLIKVINDSLDVFLKDAVRVATVRKVKVVLVRTSFLADK